MICDDAVRYKDVVRALMIEEKKADNWIDRDQLPINPLTKSRGKATRILQSDVEVLAIWMVIAEMVGPRRADEIFEDLNGYLPLEIQFEMACVTVRVDLEPLRRAIVQFIPLRAA